MITRKQFYSTVFIVFFSIFLLEYQNIRKPIHPDTGLNIIQLLQKYNYTNEIHKVTTEDGYILTLHRIPKGRGTYQKQKTPILILHGVMNSAVDFVVLGPGKALGLLLADQGYDVWLGNVRGSTWSRKHRILDPDKDRKFWDHSFHEIGIFDVPAFIDYILNVTHQKSLHFVGFSQGSSAFFVLMSEKPNYMEKIKLMSAIAPAVFAEDPSSPILKFAVYFRNTIEFLYDFLNIQEFISSDSFIASYLKYVCNENSIFVKLCLHQLFLLQGYNEEGINKTMLPLIFSNMPAGTSTKQIAHIVQLMEPGGFKQYDLGTNGNLKKYGQEKPPSYDLSKVTIPVAVYYSSNDWIINPKNIIKLKNTLPNVIKTYHVPLEKFNHDDFVHSDEAPIVVYNSIIEEIIKYS